MKKSLFFVFIFSSVFLLAQKTRVGVVNSDWVLQQLPGYVAMRDSSTKEIIRIQTTLQSFELMYAAKKQAQDSMGTESTDEWRALQNELNEIESDYKSYTDSMQRVVSLKDSIRFTPYTRSLVRASFIAAEKNKCYGTCDSKSVAAQTSGNLDYIDISKDVLKEMQHPSVITTPKRVGYCNTDSLLKLMPGYRDAQNSSEAHHKQNQIKITAMNAEIENKQKVLDSVTSPVDRKKRIQEIEELINQRELFAYMAAEDEKLNDSLLFSGFKERLNKAMFVCAKKNNCPDVYDSTKAHSTWAAKEAEFINVNADVAKELGL